MHHVEKYLSGTNTGESATTHSHVQNAPLEARACWRLCSNTGLIIKYEKACEPSSSSALIESSVIVKWGLSTDKQTEQTPQTLVKRWAAAAILPLLCANADKNIAVSRLPSAASSKSAGGAKSHSSPQYSHQTHCIPNKTNERTG